MRPLRQAQDKLRLVRHSLGDGESELEHTKKVKNYMRP